MLGLMMEFPLLRPFMAKAMLQVKVPVQPASQLHRMPSVSQLLLPRRLYRAVMTRQMARSTIMALD